MNNLKKLPESSVKSKVLLSKESRQYFQQRLAKFQPFELPKTVLNELQDNITNPETIIALLSEQIITIHNLLMTLSLRAGLEAKNGFIHRLPATNATAKLVHAFAKQVELLEVLKNPPAHKINIGSMNVTESGQAFVGTYSNN